MRTSPFFIQWWKELRAVLPVWGAVMVGLGCMPILYPANSSHDEVRLMVFIVGSLVLCSFAYSREFEDRTLMLQLLQPQRRFDVLWRKFAIVGSLQTIYFLFFIFLATNDARILKNAIQLGSIVSVLVVVSCLMWGLIFRNTLSVAVVSFVVGALFIGSLMTPIVDWFVRVNHSPNGEQFALQVILILVGVHTVSTGGLALYIWHRFQITREQSSNAELETRVTARLLGDSTIRKFPAWLAMVRKDLGLVRYLFWIGGLFVAGALVFMVVDTIMERMATVAMFEAQEHGAGSDKFQLALVSLGNIVWWQGVFRAIASALFFIQLALVPLLCGALVFTEESQLGNRAWQLCQPVRSAHQCLIKFATGLGVSLTIGLLLPVTLAVAYASLRSGLFVGLEFEKGAASQTLVAHLMLFCVAAWCATWSRATVTTALKSFLLIAGFTIVTTALVPTLDTKLASVFGYNSTMFTNTPDWRYGGLLLTLLAVGATLINFRFPDVSLRRWLGQGAAIFVSVFVLTFVLCRIGL